MDSPSYVLEMEGIVKDFPGVRALNNVNFSANRGEVLALVGENGAGKSTLMKVLSGVFPYGTYSGSIRLKGKECRFANTREAQDAGIAIIHQELNLIPEMSIAENVFLGREPLKRLRLIDYKKLFDQTRELLSPFNLELDPRTKVKDLSIGRQQLVEIAKALSVKAEILVLDEPTSALTQAEVEKLFEVIEQLKKNNVTMVYISHKLDEVFRISDRITVLRDGSTVGTYKKKDLTRDRLVALMVGRELTALYPDREKKPGETVFEVRGFYVNHPFLPGEKVVKDTSFSVKRGEVVGIAGLMGSGRSELLTALFGAFPSDCSGEIVYKGCVLPKLKSPKQAMKQGFCLVTEDRKKFGLVLGMSLAKNITLSCLEKLSRIFVIQKKKEKQEVEKAISDLQIKASSPSAPVENLSGGNQQKVVLAKWLAISPTVLFLDEPTRGVDVGARHEIYQIVNKIVAEGSSVVMVSSDLPEVLGMSDRIYVMRQGEIVAELDAAAATQETIMGYATTGQAS